MIDPAGNIVEYELDGNDNVTKITELHLGTANSLSEDATYITTNRYDSLNRLVETVDPQDHTTAYQYDLRGNLLAVQDPRGDVTSYTYDPLNRAQTRRIVTGGEDVTTTYGYDRNSRLVTHQDGRGNLTRYVYDEINRLKEVQYPEGGTITLAYDGNDNLTATTDRNGTVVDYSYDGNNRLIGKEVARGANVIGTTVESIQYDGLNRPVRITNNDAEVELTYDSRGLIWKEIQGAGTSEVRYDEIGNKKRIFYPNNSLSLDRAYDEIYRLQNIHVSGTPMVEFGYLGDERIAAKYWGSGQVSEYDYDPEGKIGRISHGGGGSIAELSYGYDAAHLRTEEAYGHLAGAKDTFTYDGGNRVKTAVLRDARTRAYTYDSTDNITGVVRDTVSTTYTVSAENKYESSGTEQFGYDGNGNLTFYADGATQKTFAYDYMNRLMRVDITGPETTQVVTFAYDAMGRRVRKTSPAGTIRYVYDGEQVVQEVNGTGSILREYIWGDETDELLAVRKGGVLYYVHENSIGSVTAISDSTGQVVERYTYDVFGYPEITDGAGNPIANSILGQPYAFQGREWDSETGLYYYRWRYFSPQLGRFISQDPEQYLDSPNLYQGFGNSPQNFRDPYGQAITPETAWDVYSLQESITETIADPYNPWNWVALTADVVSTIAPAVPAVGKFIRMGKKTDEVIDALRKTEKLDDVVDAYKTGKKAGEEVAQSVSKNLPPARKPSEIVTKPPEVNVYKPPCKMSFVAGTEVLTEIGELPIEQITAGDLVASWSEATQQLGIRAVVDTFHRQADELVVLTVGSEIIETTPEHPFWVIGKGWIEAADLQGDNLLTSSYQELPITSIASKSGNFTVYNFEVADLHNYFVSQERVLVHNCGDKDLVPAVKQRQTLLDDIVDEANRVAAPGGEITSAQREILRRNLPTVQRRSAPQTRAVRKEFDKNVRRLKKDWEEQTGRMWPLDSITGKAATPHGDVLQFL